MNPDYAPSQADQNTDEAADATPQRISTWKRKILKYLSEHLQLNDDDEQELADKIHNYLTDRKDWEIDLVAEVFHEDDWKELLRLVDTNSLPGEDEIKAQEPSADEQSAEVETPDLEVGAEQVDRIAEETVIGEPIAPPPSKPKKKTPPSVRGTRVSRSSTETGRRMVDMVEQYKRALETKSANAPSIFLRMCELALRSPEPDALNELFKLFGNPQLCLQESIFFDRISKHKTNSPAPRLNVFYNIMKSTATHIANRQPVSLSPTICRRRLGSGGSSKVRSNADRIVSFIFEKANRVAAS